MLRRRRWRHEGHRQQSTRGRRRCPPQVSRDRVIATGVGDLRSHREGRPGRPLSRRYQSAPPPALLPAVRWSRGHDEGPAPRLRAARRTPARPLPTRGAEHDDPQRKSPTTFTRSWLLWTAGFLAFPIAGLAGAAAAGRVDSPTAALIGGAISGLVLGAGQALASRRRLDPRRWIPATGVGMGIGLLLGASVAGSAPPWPTWP